MKNLFLISTALLLILFSCSQTQNTENSGEEVSEASGEPHYRKGREYYDEGNYSEAVTEFKKAVEMRINDPQTLSDNYNFLGVSYSELGYSDSAIASFEKSILYDSANTDAWVNMGIDNRLLGNYDKAEECYMKAKELDPENPKMYTSLGALYIFRGEGQKAIEVLEFAIELDPGLPIPHANYAVALAMEGRFDEAEEQLKNAVIKGYDKGDIIKERIDNLKALAE